MIACLLLPAALEAIPRKERGAEGRTDASPSRGRRLKPRERPSREQRRRLGRGAALDARPAGQVPPCELKGAAGPGKTGARVLVAARAARNWRVGPVIERMARNERADERRSRSADHSTILAIMSRCDPGRLLGRCPLPAARCPFSPSPSTMKRSWSVAARGRDRDQRPDDDL